MNHFQIITNDNIPPTDVAMSILYEAPTAYPDSGLWLYTPLS